MNSDIRTSAQSLLENIFGKDAKFRDGQYEAIEATLTNKRTLVVQKTGWGKSLVYFICAHLLRKEGKGITLIISPLLSLMQNQNEAAEKMNLRCGQLNSKQNKEEIFAKLENDEIDVLFTTPETLFNEEVQKKIISLKIGLFVIDEAHCISDWGYDFRLEYCKLRNVISSLFENIPILATTATANDRVIDDLEKQLGGSVCISRGPLLRDSLSIQILDLPTRASRYTWILKNIDSLPGSGIIYCLTQNDCKSLAGFLQENGVNVLEYHNGIKDEKLIEEAEEKFRNNEIKALVATVKLGMGYDKGDIGFIIHYQRPASIISYYQQIGRAGRSIERAYTFLMCGSDDEEIHDYFINSAFPEELESERIFNIIHDAQQQAEDDESFTGVTKSHILHKANMKKSRIEKTLSFLENEGFIMQHKPDKTIKYLCIKDKLVYNGAHYDEIRSERNAEQLQMDNFVNTKECYGRFIVNCLDDKISGNCGKCANCLGYEEFSSKVLASEQSKAIEYLKRPTIIEPRKQWINNECKPEYAESAKFKKVMENGLCLSKYGEEGFGSMVKEGKYETGRFCDELVEQSVNVLTPFISENNITAITFVPSASDKNILVSDFTERLGNKLGVAVIDCFYWQGKHKKQKNMENSECQSANIFNFLQLKDNITIPENILVIDDMVDSKWTLTVCGQLLFNAGAEKVYPFALADSKEADD